MIDQWQTELSQRIRLEKQVKKLEKQSKTTPKSASESLSFSSIFVVANASTALSSTPASKLSFSAITCVETVPHEVATPSIASELSLFIISCVETTSTTSATPTNSTSTSVATPPPTPFTTSVATSPPTPPATPNTSHSWAAIAAKPMPPTPPPTPTTRSSKSSVSKPQKRVTTYLTIDDLHRMFAGKPRRACLLTI